MLTPKQIANLKLGDMIRYEYSSPTFVGKIVEIRGDPARPFLRLQGPRDERQGMWIHADHPHLELVEVTQ